MATAAAKKAGAMGTTPVAVATIAAKALSKGTMPTATATSSAHTAIRS